MKSGNYINKFSNEALKDKKKLKNSGLDKSCKIILSLIKNGPFYYSSSYEKLCGEKIC